MKLYDPNGKLVNVDIRQSSYPIKGISKSILQGKVGKYLQDKYKLDIVLEEFIIPNTRMSVDFFLPKQGIVIEVDGEGHHGHNSFFHGNRNQCNYSKQISRDIKKDQWCELNNFKLIRITKEEEVESL